MARYGVTPNMLIVPPQLMLYMALAATDKIEYSKAGPAGPARFEAGVAGYEARAFRGLGVFTSSPYEVNDDTDSLQMLQRSTQVGEFYRMTWPVKGGDADAMDIIIYDEEMDMHVRIRALDALRALPTDVKLPEGIDDKETLIKNLKDGKDPKCDIIIARPFIEHLMMSAVMTVAGRDTGATLFGPADMQISANTSVKTIEGHYTCHTKSVITKPQNVLVLRDIMCSGYVAGGNTKFFGQEKVGADVKESKAVRDAIEKRLSFENDADGDYASMLVFVEKRGENTPRDQVISISERRLPWEVNRTAGGDLDKKYFPGGLAGFNAFNKEYGLNQIHYGEDVRAAENMEFIAQGSMNNALCFIGPHRKYTPWSQTNFELVPGQGHFGPDALPGVRAPSPRPMSQPYKTRETLCNRTPAGAVASRSRSTRRATRWCRSRRRRTRRWSSRRRIKSKP